MTSTVNAKGAHYRVFKLSSMVTWWTPIIAGQMAKTRLVALSVVCFHFNCTLSSLPSVAAKLRDPFKMEKAAPASTAAASSALP